MAKKKTVRKCPSCEIEFEDPNMTVCKYCGSVTDEVVATTRSTMNANTITKDAETED